MRAAVLYGPDDLRVQEAAEPTGEVVVEVRAATACGTDRKMLLRGHPILGGYPARFGHETAGVRLDTGERVLVGDSVACGACAPCVAGRLVCSVSRLTARSSGTLEKPSTHSGSGLPLRPTSSISSNSAAATL